MANKMGFAVARVCCRCQAYRLLLSQELRIKTDISNIRFARSLFSQEAMKMTQYTEMRAKVTKKFEFVQDKFRDRMKLHVADPNKFQIFSNDLKDFLYFMQDTENDISLCIQMIESFRKQSKELKFNMYQFGTILMRTFHYFELHDKAFNLITDPEYDTFFDRLASYVIAMDLIYENRMYENVLKVANIVKERQFYGLKYPADVTILVMASLYQMNSEESYRHLLKFLHDARLCRSFIHWRGLHFASALALKQNMSSDALELASVCNQNLTTTKNLMIMANAELNKIDAAFDMIQTEMSKDSITQPFICEDTILALTAAVARNGNNKIQQRMECIQKELRHRNFVLNESLESLLCAPIPPSIRITAKAPTFPTSINKANRKLAKKVRSVSYLDDIDE